MSKYSSFKEQQLLTEGWRNYIVEQQPITSPTPTAKSTTTSQAPAAKSNLVTKASEQTAQTSPFINSLNAGANSQEQFQILQAFLTNKNLKLKQPDVFYKLLFDMAGKLKDKPNTAQTQPVQESINESIYEGAHLDDGTLVCEACLEELLESQRTIIEEAKYQGRTVTLNKPMKGDVKKSKVYVKDPKTGNVKKVNFGDKKMKIKKNIPSRRKSFRARHNCDQKKDKTSAGYWSCKAW